jgi:hypothetical protein
MFRICFSTPLESSRFCANRSSWSATSANKTASLSLTSLRPSSSVLSPHSLSCVATLCVSRPAFSKAAIAWLSVLISLYSRLDNSGCCMPRRLLIVNRCFDPDLSLLSPFFERIDAARFLRHRSEHSVPWFRSVQSTWGYVFSRI